MWTHLALFPDRTRLHTLVSSLASLYAKWQWGAIAIVGRYSTRHFVLLAKVAAEKGLKPIYAVEILSHAPGGRRGFPMTVVAVSQKGIENIYALMSTIQKRRLRVLEPKILQKFGEGLVLLVGREIEECEENRLDAMVSYYERTYGKNWYVECRYTLEKPVEKLRHLVDVVNRFHLRALATVGQEWDGGEVVGYERVREIFCNHPDFVEEVERFVAGIPVLSPLPLEASTVKACEYPLQREWLEGIFCRCVRAFVRYGLPFLVRVAPLEVKDCWLHFCKERGIHQEVMFFAQTGRMEFLVNERLLPHVRWLVNRWWRGYVGMIPSQKGNVFVVTRFPLEKGFSIVGEKDGFPVVDTFLDGGEGFLILRMVSSRLWNVVSLAWGSDRLGFSFPIALRWVDHPFFFDEGFLYSRRHVVHGMGVLFREISRVMHPSLRGPFVYMEEALLYLQRFVDRDQARRFLFHLRRQHPLWIEEKREIEQRLSPEARESIHWRSLLNEGRYLVSRRWERLKHTPLAYALLLLQRDPLLFTLACLKQCSHTREKNRVILYARFVLGVEFLPPLLGKSDFYDSIENGKIRLGFCHLTMVSEKERKQMLFERPYRNFFDFLQRNPHVSKKVLVEWIRMGVFDDLEPANEYKLVIVQNKREEDTLLFDAMEVWRDNENAISPLFYERLRLSEVLGLYVVESPQEKYKSRLGLFHRSFLKDTHTLRFGVYVAAVVGMHKRGNDVYFEIVDETAWRRVVFHGSPPFLPELFSSVVWRLVLNREELEVVEMFGFG